MDTCEGLEPITADSDVGSLMEVWVSDYKVCQAKQYGLKKCIDRANK